MASKIGTDCVVCAFAPMFKLGQLCGVFPIKFNCSHRSGSNPVIKREFAPSKWLLLISALYECFVFFTASAYLYVMVKTFGENKGKSIDNVTYLVPCWGAAIMIPYLVYRRGSRISDLNQLSGIIKKRRLYGLKIFLDRKDVIVMRCLCTISCMLVSSIAILPLIPLMISSEGYSEILLRSGCAFANLVEYIFLFQFIMLGYLTQFTIKRIHGNLMEKMSKYLLLTRFFRAESESSSLAEILGLTRRLHGKIYRNWNSITNIYGFPAILLILILVVSLIMYSYILISAFNNHARTVAEARLVFLILVSVVFTWTAEKTSRENDQLRSFLNKFPISKLNKAEANQIEMLLMMLRIQKPVLRASDMFTVGTGLIASISGTVITYVLVALQFHASWSNKGSR